MLVIRRFSSFFEEIIIRNEIEIRIALYCIIVASSVPAMALAVQIYFSFVPGHCAALLVQNRCSSEPGHSVLALVVQNYNSSKSGHFVALVVRNYNHAESGHSVTRVVPKLQ